MNSAVNGRFLARRVTGVERYGREVMHCLPDKLWMIHLDWVSGRLGGHAWEQFILPRRLRSDEILWSPANTGPLAVANQVLTIHDLSPLEHPEWYHPAFAWWYRWLWPALARRVKMITAPSEFVRRKIISRFALRPEQVISIPAGVDMDRFHPCAAPKQKNVLYVGSLAPRKNLLGLLRAWDLIKNKYPDYVLTIAGASGNNFSNNDFPQELERVKCVGYVPESDLPALYARATLFVLPSFDEGFGLPVLEAMACGTPVVASSAGALPEVIGAAGLFFDPHDHAAMAARLNQVLDDAILREHLRAQGLARAAEFSWRATAENIWRVLQA